MRVMRLLRKWPAFGTLCSLFWLAARAATRETMNPLITKKMSRPEEPKFSK
jgi:hypothetical protein